MLAPTFGRIAIDRIEPQSYREILRAWCAQREGQPIPEKDRIDPFLVPALAGNLILYEVSGEDFVFRVVGEKVLTAVGANLRGMTLRQALGDRPYRHMIERQLSECAACGVPLYSRHDFHIGDDASLSVSHNRRAWRIALPYGEAGRVTRLLCYQLFSKDFTARAPQDVDFEALLPKTVFKIDV
ncbi:MAG: hypothetical protein Kow00114_21930 [Kiloniellaceae bacterium]